MSITSQSHIEKDTSNPTGRNHRFGGLNPVNLAAGTVSEYEKHPGSSVARSVLPTTDYSISACPSSCKCFPHIPRLIVRRNLDNYPDNISMDYSNSSMFSKAGDSITLPVYKPLASTVLMINESSNAKSEKVLRGKDFIRNLLTFQVYDGSFEIRALYEIEKKVNHKLPSIIMDLRGNNDTELVITVAITVFLEEMFDFCRDLWQLLWHKARNYVEHQLFDQGERNMLEYEGKNKGGVRSIRRRLSFHLDSVSFSGSYFSC